MTDGTERAAAGCPETTESPCSDACYVLGCWFSRPSLSGGAAEPESSTSGPDLSTSSVPHDRPENRQM